MVPDPLLIESRCGYWCRCVYFFLISHPLTQMETHDDDKHRIPKNVDHPG
jgi:hypothetical protein